MQRVTEEKCASVYQDRTLAPPTHPPPTLNSPRVGTQESSWINFKYANVDFCCSLLDEGKSSSCVFATQQTGFHRSHLNSRNPCSPCMLKKCSSHVAGELKDVVVEGSEYKSLQQQSEHCASDKELKRKRFYECLNSMTTSSSVKWAKTILHVKSIVDKDPLNVSTRHVTLTRLLVSAPINIFYTTVVMATLCYSRCLI